MDVQLSLGDLYMAKGDIDGAIKIYCDTIAIDGENYLSYSKVGLALWEKDYLEESLVAFHKSIDLNPEFKYLSIISNIDFIISSSESFLYI